MRSPNVQRATQTSKASTSGRDAAAGAQNQEGALAAGDADGSAQALRSDAGIIPGHTDSGMDTGKAAQIGNAEESREAGEQPPTHHPSWKGKVIDRFNLQLGEFTLTRLGNDQCRLEHTVDNQTRSYLVTLQDDVAKRFQNDDEKLASYLGGLVTLAYRKDPNFVSAAFSKGSGSDQPTAVLQGKNGNTTWDLNDMVPIPGNQPELKSWQTYGFIMTRLLEELHGAGKTDIVALDASDSGEQSASVHPQT